MQKSLENVGLLLEDLFSGLNFCLKLFPSLALPSEQAYCSHCFSTVWYIDVEHMLAQLSNDTVVVTGSQLLFPPYRQSSEAQANFWLVLYLGLCCRHQSQGRRTVAVQ